VRYFREGTILALWRREELIWAHSSPLFALLVNMLMHKLKLLIPLALDEEFDFVMERELLYHIFDNKPLEAINMR